MANKNKPLTQFEKEFIARVRTARKRRFTTVENLLEAMGYAGEQPRFSKYESRTVLPHEFIAQFCAATGVSIPWLFTGKEMDIEVEPLPETRKRTKRGGEAPKKVRKAA